MKLTLLSCFCFPILLCRTAVLKIFLFFSKVASIKLAALVTLRKNESIQVFFENLRKFFRTPLGNYCRQKIYQQQGITEVDSIINFCMLQKHP